MARILCRALASAPRIRVWRWKVCRRICTGGIDDFAFSSRGIPSAPSSCAITGVTRPPTRSGNRAVTGGYRQLILGHGEVVQARLRHDAIVKVIEADGSEEIAVGRLTWIRVRDLLHCRRTSNVVGGVDRRILGVEEGRRWFSMQGTSVNRISKHPNLHTGFGYLAGAGPAAPFGPEWRVSSCSLNQTVVYPGPSEGRRRNLQGPFAIVGEWGLLLCLGSG